MASDQPSPVSTPSSDGIEPDDQLAITSSTITSAAVARLTQAFGLVNRLADLNSNIDAPLIQKYIQKAIDLLSGIDESEEIVVCF